MKTPTPTVNGIHWRILKRVLLGWLIVAPLTALSVYYFETERMDEIVADLAIQKTRGLSITHLDALSAPLSDNSAQAELKALADTHLQGNFLVVEFYDPQKNKVAEAVAPGAQRVEQELKTKQHVQPSDQGVSYRKVWVDEHLYVQIMAPLYQGPQIRGYFEGVYHVSAEELNKLTDTVLHLVGLSVLIATVVAALFYPLLLSLHSNQVKLSRALMRGNLELLEVMGGAIAKRDSDTNEHNYRVTLYAIALARRLRLDDDTIRSLISGAFLHDVGKIGITDSILLKNGKLDDAEFTIMKTHVQLGLDILKKSDWLQSACAVVGGHHEKYDGSGYPKGLKGEAIPLSARVFAVVDVFDALTSRRPYKEPFPLEKAVSILKESRGSHFDPKVIDTFLEMAPNLLANYANMPARQLEQELQQLTEAYFIATLD